LTQIIQVRADASHTAFIGNLAATPSSQCGFATLLDSHGGRPASAGLGTPGNLTMKSNVGGIDRILRIVLGLVLIGLTLNGSIGVWGWLGLIPLATAAIGFCPLYTVIGISSCPMKKT